MSIVGYGLGINGDTIDYAVVYGFGITQLFPEGIVPSNLYVISEELRFFLIFKEVRDIVIESEVRTNIVEFENRMVLVPKKDN